MYQLQRYRVFQVDQREMPPLLPEGGIRCWSETEVRRRRMHQLLSYRVFEVVQREVQTLLRQGGVPDAR